MGKIHAGGIAWLRKYFREHHPEREPAFIGSLSPEERSTYEVTMTTSTLPLESFVSLLKKACPVLFAGEPDGLRKLGQLQAVHNMRGISKIFLKVATINSLIGQTTAVWKTYHDTGEASVEPDPTLKNHASRE